MAAANPPVAGALVAPATGRSFVHGLDYKWQVLMCTIFGTFMTTLDTTIVNIALPKITSVFGVNVNQAQLVVTSYMLALAVIMPATGFLGDTFGTKRLYLTTMALFTSGSLLCGLAWDNTSLVAFRVIQGLGGGMMSPLGMTMIFRAVPARERNAVMGLYGLPLMLAPVLGPTLGGYIVEYVDWRVIFTLNVPIGIAGLFMGWTLLRESERVKGLKFDVRGFLLSAVAFSSLLLGLSDADTDGWTSPGILARFAIGGIALVAWIWVELMDTQPLVELRLFKDRTFTLAMTVNFVLTVGMFGGQLLVPLFLQNFRGLGAGETGLITMAQALGMLPLMPIMGRVADRVPLRIILLLGLPLVGLTTWQFANLDVTTPDNTLRLMLALRGASLGVVMMPAMTAALNAAPLHLMSRASSLTNVARQVFGSFGTAIFVTILQNRQIYHQAMLAQTATPQNFALQQALVAAQQWATGHGLSDAQGQLLGVIMVMRQLGLDAAVMAFQDVFRVAALVTLLAMVPALFLKTARPGGRSEGHGTAAAAID
ncbi:MAG: DHA2 family efflux MFS transporter permease subunit [Chloroflexi bacterium]|nr:DHA2 family efflux MFS transporter permease subunit [Chloroflexota bacterium]